MHAREEVSRRFVVPSSDSAKGFELAEKVLNQMSRLIEVFVKVPLVILFDLGGSFEFRVGYVA
jgi:hypothetical protein